MDDTTWVPASCTLPTAEQPLRVAELDALFRRALRRVERTSATRAVMTLDGEDDLVATVEDLAGRETSCCSFFSFAVTQGADGAVALAVEVPPGQVDVLDALAARAAAAVS